MSQWTTLEEYVPGEGDVAMILITEEDELDNSTSAISSSSLLGTPSADNTTIFSQPTPDSHLQEVPTRHSRTSHTTTSTKSSQKAAPQSSEDTRALSRARARSSELADQTSGKQSQVRVYFTLLITSVYTDEALHDSGCRVLNTTMTYRPSTRLVQRVSWRAVVKKSCVLSRIHLYHACTNTSLCKEYPICVTTEEEEASGAAE